MRRDGAFVQAPEDAEPAVRHDAVRLGVGAAQAHGHRQGLHQQRGLVQRGVVVAGRLAPFALVAQDGLCQAHEAGLLVGREVVARAVLSRQHDEGVARRIAAVVARVVEQRERGAGLRAAPRATRVRPPAP